MAPERDGMVKQATLFVAEQIRFAHVLAGNDPNKREKAIKKLRKFLQVKSKMGDSFSEDDFLRIWKGLFYCLWMSDKPLVQEELAEEISSLVHVFPQVDETLLFIKCFFLTILKEWYGIDYHRLEKFSLFVRRFLRQSLFYCKRKKWNLKTVVGFSNVLRSTILSIEENNKETFDISLILHFLDIFLEELAKVGEGKLSSETLVEILDPFADNLSKQEDERIQNAIKSDIFDGLIEQTPEKAEYEAKMKAWRNAGYPGSSWKDMVFVGEGGKQPHRGMKVSLKNMDPRAGGVNVFLPEIKFDPLSIVKLLERFEKQSKNKAIINKIIASFLKYAEGEYPFAEDIPKTWLNLNKTRISKKYIENAAEELCTFKGQMKALSKPENTVKRKQVKKKVRDEKSNSTKKKLKRDRANTSKNKENLPRLELNEMNLELDEESDSKEIPEISDTNVAASTEEKKTKRPKKRTARKKRKERKLPQAPAAKVETNETDAEVSSNEIETEIKIDNGMKSSEETKMKIDIQEKSSEEPKIVSSKSGDFKEFYAFKGLFSDYQKIKSEKNMTERSRVMRPAKRKWKSRGVPVFSFERNSKNVSNTRDSRQSVNNSIIDTSDNFKEVHEQNSDNTSNTQDSILEISNNIKDGHENLSNTHDSILEMSGKGEDATKSISYCEENKSCVEDDDPKLIKIIETPSTNKKVNKTPSTNKKVNIIQTPSTNKKVNIVLQKNKSQAMSEYLESVKQSPSVPHDGSKKPFKGVLKRSSIQSPINPFYKSPKMQKKAKMSGDFEELCTFQN